MHLGVLNRISCVTVGIMLAASVARSQNASADQTQEQESKRIFGIIPNYRTSPSLLNYEPLSAAEKFKLASEDSFDRGTIALAATFGGLGQLTNSNRSFGQGAAGFGRYFGAAYGDLVIGDYMTEAVFPVLLHQDPRYFRRGTGSGWSRLRLCGGADFLDPSRHRWNAVQLFRDTGQFRRDCDLDGLLPR